jgi:transcription factor WhiB
VTADQRSVFVQAAALVGVSTTELEGVVRGASDRPCRGRSTDEFFPAGPVDPGQLGRLREERNRARRLCAGCPVKAECLAWDFGRTEGHVQELWGIYGGLGVRDRRSLFPLWGQLRERLGLTPSCEVAAVDAATGESAPALASAA